MDTQPTELGRSRASAAAEPAVAVVVATYGRAELLPRLVRALEGQDLDPGRFEVVIVDDASDDETPVVLRRLTAGTDLPATALRLARNAGPGAARNEGWRAASAPIVAFTDDDCVPARSWLRSGLEALQRPGTDVVVGRTLPAPDQPRGPFSRTLHVEDARHAPACNVFYRRDALEQAGGFEERLRSGEDTDLMLRVRRSGGEVSFVPDAVVHHDVSPSSVQGALRDAWRWADLPGVVGRHPEVRATHLHLRLFWKRAHLPAILAVAGLVLAGRRASALGLALPWLHHRLVREPLAAGRRTRLASLPGALLVDLAEVATMVRGSLRHRTPVL